MSKGHAIMMGVSVVYVQRMGGGQRIHAQTCPTYSSVLAVRSRAGVVFVHPCVGRVDACTITFSFSFILTQPRLGTPAAPQPWWSGMQGCAPGCSITHAGVCRTTAAMVQSPMNEKGCGFERAFERLKEDAASRGGQAGVTLGAGEQGPASGICVRLAEQGVGEGRAGKAVGQEVVGIESLQLGLLVGGPVQRLPWGARRMGDERLGSVKPRGGWRRDVRKLDKGRCATIVQRAGWWEALRQGCGSNWGSCKRTIHSGLPTILAGWWRNKRRCEASQSSVA